MSAANATRLFPSWNGWPIRRDWRRLAAFSASVGYASSAEGGCLWTGSRRLELLRGDKRCVLAMLQHQPPMQVDQRVG